MNLIESLNLPDDLKHLATGDMNRLAREVRDKIIKVVSTNGGHLAPSLGVVDLTIALLSVMNVPEDKIVWDVGHQCYAYKLLTDRRDRFHTLRKPGGISGFPRPGESRYDAFVAGHASTSISAALGIAHARDLAGDDYKVIAVIGDGALGGGMVWEAINNAGGSKADLLVILNDNNMSISPSIGAMATHISRLRAMPLYRTVENSAQRIIDRLPLGGNLANRTSRMLKHGVTSFVSPTSGAIFESMGFEYLGPIDGHDIMQIRRFLVQAREMSGPVLLHIVTTKGKGYLPAEHDARQFHGVGPFDCSNGKCSKKTKNAFTDVFSSALTELAKRDPKLVAITAAMPDGTGLNRFADEFPDRFFDVGIAEEHAVTFAAGLARAGAKPVVAIYSTFLQRAYDQIVHDVCLQNLPVVFALDRAGIVGEDGPTHHGVFDLSYLRHIPNLTLMAPRNAAELGDMLYTALQMNSPSAIRYPRGDAEGIWRLPMREIPRAKAEVLNAGNDVAIITVGTLANAAAEAAIELEEAGIHARVIDARFIKPLDEETILSAALECGAMVIAEENVVQGGFSGAVLECLAKNNALTGKIEIIGLPDAFVSHGKAAEIRAKYALNTAGIKEAAARVMSETKGKGEEVGIRRNI